MDNNLRVLYEDNHIIAVYKPAGLLVQGDITGDRSLIDEVKEYLRVKYKKQGNVFLGLVHRLDRNVSGIVLFGKTSKGASRLSEQFRNHEVKKIYHAVVEGKVEPASGSLVDYLKKNEERKISLISDSEKPGYDYSELYYETIKTGRNRSLLRIELKTGRFHQIRSQLSHLGYPIAGDTKYGSRDPSPDKFLALCATEITFKTATTGDIIKLKIDYPKEWDKLII